jgi:hypothetical protein
MKRERRIPLPYGLSAQLNKKRRSGEKERIRVFQK